jgi:hypothetical protein
MNLMVSDASGTGIQHTPSSPAGNRNRRTQKVGFLKRSHQQPRHETAAHSHAETTSALIAGAR